MLIQRHQNDIKNFPFIYYKITFKKQAEREKGISKAHNLSDEII